ncbi:MAG: hypothetical protein M1376_03295 [Planctomycetes bacterium]|nr:hypothetical protein [Planctomycetota bacterium]
MKRLLLALLLLLSGCQAFSAVTRIGVNFDRTSLAGDAQVACPADETLVGAETAK